MGGVHIFRLASPESDGKDIPCYPVSRSDAEWYLQHNQLKIPVDSDIWDSSKTQWLSKTVVLVQCTWFLIQFLSRISQKLPLTTLEIITVAYLLVYLCIWIAWRDKPSGIDNPIRLYVVNAQRGPKPIKTFTTLEKIVHFAGTVDTYIRGAHDRLFNLHQESYIPIFYSGIYDDAQIAMPDILTIFVGIFFGAIHFIAWSTQFPTEKELMLWRISCLTIIIFPGICVMVLIVWIAFFMIFPNIDTTRMSIHLVIGLIFLFICLQLCGTAYVFARIASLVLSLMELRDIPRGAYQTPHWTDWVPHL